MSTFDDILSGAGDVLASIAPTVATALGGPLAGLAVTKLEQVLGLAPGTATTDPAAVVNAVNATAITPDRILALKAADAELERFFAENRLAYARLEVEDRKDARSMQVQTRDWMPRVLALSVVALAAGSAFLLFTDQMPAARDPVTGTTVGAVLGYLFNEFKQVLAFWFGSSSSSRDKDATIAKLSG